METEVVPAESPGSLGRVLVVLRAGGLVSFPTDTVYGLGALAFEDAAVRRLYRAKRRSTEKSIPILLADAADLDLVASHVPSTALRLSRRFWPGALTLILHKHARVPKSVSADASVGVRVPAHALARTLLQAAGPMAVTSANISGQPSPTTAAAVRQQLDGRIPLILDGGESPGGAASTIVDCTQAELIVVRAGPISLEDIRHALE